MNLFTGKNAHSAMDGRLQEIQDSMEVIFITDSCTGCGSCMAVCPQNCILSQSVPYVMEQEYWSVLWELHERLSRKGSS